MARTKRASDELYNARRRVRRAAERLERAGDVAGASSLRELARTGGSTDVSTLNAAYSALKSKAVTPPTSSVTSKPTTQASRAKRASDELYNERRRQRRLADRLERQAQAATGADAAALRGFAARLRDLAEKSKMGRKTSDELRREAAERMREVTDRGHERELDRTSRRNWIFRQAFNAAGESPLGITEQQRNVFWNATKLIWARQADGMGPWNYRQRYDAIANHFYGATADGEEFRAWLEDQGRQLRPGDLTDVFEFIMSRQGEAANDSALPYADYINRVVFFG